MNSSGLTLDGHGHCNLQHSGKIPMSNQALMENSILRTIREELGFFMIKAENLCVFIANFSNSFKIRLTL